MLAALGQEIPFLARQDPFPVVIGVGNVTSETGKIGHELFSNFEDGLTSRMQIHLVVLRFVLEGSPDFRDRGNRKDIHDDVVNRSIDRRARGFS